MKKFLVIGLVVAMSLMSLAGCGGNTDQPSSNEESTVLSGKVVIAGSTSVQPLSELLAEEFMAMYPEVSVEVQGGGSSVGVKSAKDAIADIGAASREVKESEKEFGLTEYVVAKDGIAIVVNSASDIENLTMEELQMIYIGEITNWNQVGGADADITVVTREEGSGTRGAFVELTKVLQKNAEGNKIDLTTENALVQPSTGSVKNTVKNTPDSIGYISLGALDSTVKSIMINDVEVSVETILRCV